jgi:hypothetical protein
MAGQILTLPLRLTARAVSLALHGGEQVAGRVLGLALQVAGMTRSRGDGSDFAVDFDSPVGSGEGANGESSHSPEPEPEPGPPIDAENVIDLDAPPEQEPQHVSEEPVLAAEFAEPGAEDGAGAQIHVKEPWPGYGELNAKDVIARIGSSDRAELAAIELFESTNQKRQTVLLAVERQLKLVDHDSASDHERSDSNA